MCQATQKHGGTDEQIGNRIFIGKVSEITITSEITRFKFINKDQYLSFFRTKDSGM